MKGRWPELQTRGVSYCQYSQYTCFILGKTYLALLSATAIWKQTPKANAKAQLVQAQWPQLEMFGPSAICLDVDGVALLTGRLASTAESASAGHGVSRVSCLLRWIMSPWSHLPDHARTGSTCTRFGGCLRHCMCQRKIWGSQQLSKLGGVQLA